MHKEKDIEDMVNIFKSRFSEEAQAKELQNAGYGNIKQAVREFAEKLLLEVKSVIKKHEIDYAEAEKKCDKYMIGFYTAQEEDYLSLENSIRKLIKEKFGEEVRKE